MSDTITPPPPETKAVNVIIGVDELEEMRQVTGVDGNAPALLCAARKGVQLLKRMQEVAETSLAGGSASVS